MTRRAGLIGTLVLAGLLGATAAEAHTGVGAAGLAAGFAHPFQGLDHLLAMVAVGLWAGQREDAGRWLIPSGFVAVLAGGAAAGVAGVGVPWLEFGILTSVVLLGLLVMAGRALPLSATAALVAAFALVHGHAHGAEIPAAASAIHYGAGILLASAALHGIGFALARLLGAGAHGATRALLGGAVAAAGLLLVVL
ncbi:MAG: HupE/UreJ family protein [Alphaproteobacteria bacterium]|nr:HupE/UreJ family protein [Alphaproteobacteria bacterium]